MTQPTQSPSTAPTPPTELALRVSPLAGVIFTLFLSLGFLSCVWLMLKGSIEFVPKAVTQDMLLHGDITHRFAKTLSDAPAPKQAADLERGASWLAFGDLGPRVREGCPDWLFLTDELRVNHNATFNARAKAQAVIELQQGLARRGIQLVVAVVPDKSRIVATQLCQLTRPALLAPRIGEWLTLLQGAGVPTLDLTPTLQAVGEGAYLRTDTHWSEAGARAAAGQVAQTVTGLKFTATPHKNFEQVTQASALRPGDLVRLAGIDWLPLMLQPRTESVAATQVKEQAEEATGADNLDDLFGDDNLPNTALIGTSFSRNSNFLGFLEAAVGAPVGNFARDGGEFSGAAKAYFDSPAFRQTPPKLVVWEIPERDLQTPYGNDIRLP
ncbi:alginate O-acetyltransferase AlgX-related protein [Pseudomonas gingeri]|uniref:alginate O-acetyltransferase AlgX-related protein n=1 Tax=Pseudomonas gingeri TaxID=117681 RepID=UPI0015A46FBC|nr:cell division protein FtsQ [Pseudomonas gingeri]NWD08966.1 cell division protein FtsQ [Pseudomonas gingeri]NWE34797.1 cell division protein FtsQ [Pseudomonas gingeri]NWE56898.1 cell division protein FtsQ [Pseudomonas gingeri]NWF02037.1 cell division protein FtsQ [Pseudomonas gingeri]